MNSKLTSILLLALGTSSVTVLAEEGGGHIEKPYLGQDPPGSSPEPFAPGIVTSTGWEYGGIFSPDMREFYVLKRVEDETTWQHVYRYRNGEWHEEVLWERQGTPFIAPDGETMHVGRGYKVRTADGWSEMKRLGEAFEPFRIMRLTASTQRTYYFDEVGSESGDGRIRFSRIVDGERQPPQLVSEAINSGTWLAHPFIAPDESYLLFDGRREGGYGDSDIYVSFRQADGSWGEAVNLGETVNTDRWEASATVTPDGKYLFFHRNISDGDNDIYWMDASIIDRLRRKQAERD